MTSKFEEKSPDESAKAGRVPLAATVSAETFQKLQQWSHKQQKSVGQLLDALISGRQDHTSDQKEGIIDTHLREAAINPKRSALLFVDVQNFSCHRKGVCHQGNADATHLEYWWQVMEEVQPKWRALQQICREAGIEVMYTVMESMTQDGRDRSLDYKISGFHIPPKSFDAQVLECIEPGEDEIVISKTSSSVFMTTNIDTILRNLDVRNLILAGVLTDQCVESAVRDACDLNYLVTLVSDGCATYSRERHEGSCKAIKGYCRQRTFKELEAEISDLISS